MTEDVSPIDGLKHTSVWGKLNDHAARLEKLESELITLRGWVYKNCRYSGYYRPEICGKCELVKWCWPPSDYADGWKDRDVVNRAGNE